MNKPTREQFIDYLILQKSGITNMYNIPFIVEHSTHGLTKEECLYIYENYSNLEKEYDITVADIRLDDDDFKRIKVA